MSSLVSILLSKGTQELINHLIDTGLSVGTGKIWKEIRNRMERESDTIETRLYAIIEASVLKFLYQDKDDDIFAVICEEIFYIWCTEGDIKIERVNYVLRHASKYVKPENVHAWHQYLTLQILKDKELYQVFMINNVQLFKESCKMLEKNITKLMQESLNGKGNDIIGDIKHIRRALGELAISTKKKSSNKYLSSFDGDLINILEELFVMEEMIDIVKNSIIGEASKKMMYIEAFVGDEMVWQSDKIAYIANKDRDQEFADICKAKCIDELLECSDLEDFILCVFSLSCEENSTFPVDKVSVTFVDPKTDVLCFGIEISCVDAQTGAFEYGFIDWDEYDGILFKGNWMERFHLWLK